MLVMGLVLGALGVVVYVGAERSMYGSIDRDLIQRANGMMRRPPGPPNGFGFAIGAGPPITRRTGPPPQPNNAPDLRPLILRADGSLPPRLAPGGQPGEDGPPYDAQSADKALTGAAGFSDIVRNGETVRVYTTPIQSGGRIAGVVQVAYGIGDIQRSLAQLRQVLVTVVIPIGVLLSGLASLFLVSSLVSPIAAMRRKAEEIEASSLDGRLPSAGKDEFAALAGTLNAMLGRLQAAFEQEQESKRQLEESVAQQRRFTADASHELKTPLSVVKANTGLALNGSATSEEYRDALAEIDAAADRMSKLVADLLILARVEAGHLSATFDPVDLNQLVDQAVQQVPAAKGQIEVLNSPDPLTVSGSRHELNRIFVNLVDNAVRHGASHEPVQVSVERKADGARVSIADKGVGIAPNHLEHLFERFYRVDKSRSSETGGTGLGLAICKGVVEAHGGTISVKSLVGKGTTIIVTLPVARGVD